jgi:hypothetical protein
MFCDGDSDDELLGSVMGMFDDEDASTVASVEDCDLCARCIDKGDKSNHPKMGFKCLHLDCFNALKCLERLASKDQKLQIQIASCRAKDPEKFKCIAFTLSKQKHKRTQASREQVVQYIEVLTRTVNVKKKKAFLLLPKDQFIAWHMMNCRLSETDAKAKWEDCAHDPDLVVEDDDGEVCVKVKKPTEISQSDTLASTKSVTSASKTMDKASASKRLSEKPDIPLSANSNVSQLSLGLFGFGAKGLPRVSDRARV